MADEALKELRRIRELLEKMAAESVIDVRSAHADDPAESLRRHKHVRTLMHHKV